MLTNMFYVFNILLILFMIIILKHFMYDKSLFKDKFK